MDRIILTKHWAQLLTLGEKTVFEAKKRYINNFLKHSPYNQTELDLDASFVTQRVSWDKLLTSLSFTFICYSGEIRDVSEGFLQEFSVKMPNKGLPSEAGSELPQ